MNGLRKPFRKNPTKNRKNNKNQSEIAACELKTTSEKANFCSNTVFSLNFEIRAKKFHAAKPLAFSPFPVSALPKSLLQFDLKYHEIVRTNLETAPQYNSNSLICNKPREGQ